MSPARKGSADQRPRIRSIKPERWHEEGIGGLSRDARLLYDVLWTLADDDGRLRALPALIIGHGYPYDEDVTPAKVRRWIAEVETGGLLVSYESAGRPYIWLRRFVDDQVIDRRRPSVLPPPPVVDVSTKDRRDTPVAVDDALTAPRAGGGSDRIGSETPSSPFNGKGEQVCEQREDVARLCRLLGELMVANDPKAKAAPVSKAWTDPMRLLLDRDGRSEPEVEQLIRWSQAHEFWRSNILSPAKLRKQAGPLKLRMEAEGLRSTVEKPPPSSAQIGASLETFRAERARRAGARE